MTTTDITATTARPAAAAARPTGNARDLAWAGMRIVVGFLFACHGAQGLFGAFGGIDGAGGAVAVLSWPGWWGSAINLVGGLLVLVGLFTRAAAFVSSGAMAFAYFAVHQPMGALPLQNMGEPAALYAWVFLAIAAIGPGRYALDSLRGRARRA
ncbi:DoxX family protein [Pseudonocardia nigra]|uniref:DoxX family protein n=1 Tax=Pseudonocardia nigra TaxID=1921578 RepID=UPI001C5EE597|nr:DoxX family protein [Pseudonocardia nigra]